MIVELKTEFSTIAVAKGAVFQSKSISELEDYAQNYDFASPLINWKPLERFPSNYGSSSQITYSVPVTLQFLTKFEKDNNFETTKDVLIDQMILLSQQFYRELFKNGSRIFNVEEWSMSNTILRQYTSNLLCGCESNLTLTTGCNRI